MGAALSIFGKINEESPHFSLLKKTAEYEIRRYAQAIAVETSYEAVRLFFVCDDDDAGLLDDLTRRLHVFHALDGVSHAAHLVFLSVQLTC